MINKSIVTASAIVLGLTACSQAPATKEQAQKAATATAPAIAAAPDVVAHFQKANLPVGKTTQVTAENDPNHLLGRPSQYVSATYFADTRYPKSDLDDNLMQKVEVFANAADAKARADYIREVTKGVAFLTTYVLQRGRVVVMLDQIMTPDQVAEYQKALDQLPAS